MNHYKSESWEYILRFEVEDLNAVSSRRAQPVAIRREDKGMYGVTSFKRIQVFAVVQVPQHGDAVLAARGSKGAIRGNGDSVDVASMAVVVCAELAFRQFPDLFHKPQWKYKSCD